MSYGNVFGTGSAKYDVNRIPAWIEVRRQKLAGGTLDVSHNKKGDLIPLGIPVYLNEMGGVAVVLDTFKVTAVSASDVTLGQGAYGTYASEGLFIMKKDGGAKAVKLGNTEDGLKFSLDSDASSEFTAQSEVILAEAASEDSPVKLLPNGLSRRDIYIDVDNPTKATIAVVTDGQILVDRIPDIDEEYRKALTNIDFESEYQKPD